MHRPRHQPPAQRRIDRRPRRRHPQSRHAIPITGPLNGTDPFRQLLKVARNGTHVRYTLGTSGMVARQDQAGVYASGQRLKWRVRNKLKIRKLFAFSLIDRGKPAERFTGNARVLVVVGGIQEAGVAARRGHSIMTTERGPLHAATKI
ncbi:MAG: hypothetical protein WD534_18175 [Phycisphaeraceae bacterium]